MRLGSLALVVGVVLALVPLNPVAAADLAAGNCDDSRSSTHFDVYVASNGCDASDTTMWICTTCWAGGAVHLSVDLTAAYVIESVRLLTTPGNAGGGGGVFIAYSDDGSAWTNAESQLPAQSSYYTDSGSGVDAKRLFVFTMAQATAGAGCLPTCGVLDAHRYWRVGTGGGQSVAGFRVYTFELLGDVVTSVPITDYVYNFRYTHPPFARQITWDWRKVFEGSWVITDSDDTILFEGTRSINGLVGDHVFPLVIQCPIICGADTYTLSITDTTNSQSAGFSWSSDADGVLLPNLRAPDVLWGAACYNSTLNECASPLDGAAGKVVIQYEWTGDGDGVVAFCPVAASGPPDCAAGTWFSTTQTEGVHAVTFTITQGGNWLVRVTDEIGRSDYVVLAIDYTTPGVVTYYVPPPAVEADCESSDNLCFLRNIPGAVASAMFDLLRALFQPGCSLVDGRLVCVDFTLMSSFTSLRLALLAHEPTASLVLSGERASELLAELEASVDASAYEFCYSGDVTLWRGVGATSTRTLSLCLDFEPIGGSDIWQDTIRPLLGGLVYFGTILKIGQRFIPRPVVGG